MILPTVLNTCQIVNISSTLLPFEVSGSSYLRTVISGLKIYAKINTQTAQARVLNNYIVGKIVKFNGIISQIKPSALQSHINNPRIIAYIK